MKLLIKTGYSFPVIVQHGFLQGKLYGQGHLIIVKCEKLSPSTGRGRQAVAVVGAGAGNWKGELRLLGRTWALCRLRCEATVCLEC